LSLRTIIYLILLLLALYFLFTKGFTLVLAFLLAFLLEPAVAFVSTRLQVKRAYASIAVCSLFTLVILALGYLLVAIVLGEATALSRMMLSFTKDLSHGIDALVARYQSHFQSLSPAYQYNLQQATKSLLDSLQSILKDFVSLSFNLAKSIPGLLIETLIVFIAMFLISLRLPGMKAFLLNFFEREDHPRVEKVLSQLHHAIFGFIRAQIIISTIEFIFVFTGFVILGIKYPSASALFVTLVDILPVLGTGAVMLPMVIYQYLTGNIFLGTGLFVHYSLIVVFRRIIDPKIMADSIGISALAALASMYLGVKAAGFVGLFLGPAVVILLQAMIKVGLINIKIKF